MKVSVYYFIKLMPCVLLVFLFLNSNAQYNFIGMQKQEVQEKLKKDREFFEDNSVVKKAFNYLKFVDSRGNKTMLVFFNDNDICTSVKIMIDYAELNSTIAKLNEKYKKLDEQMWFMPGETQDAKVELIKEQWFFSLKVKPEDK